MIALFLLALMMIPVTMGTSDWMTRTDRRIASELDNRINSL